MVGSVLVATPRLRLRLRLRLGGGVAGPVLGATSDSVHGTLMLRLRRRLSLMISLSLRARDHAHLHAPKRTFSPINILLPRMPPTMFLVWLPVARGPLEVTDSDVPTLNIRSQYRETPPGPARHGSASEHCPGHTSLYP